MVMGQPDRCQHAVHLINELIQTAQVSLTHTRAHTHHMLAHPHARTHTRSHTHTLLWSGSAVPCDQMFYLIPVQERDGFSSALRGGRVRGRGDWTVGSPGPLQEVTYTIPADKCGLVIGKGRSGPQVRTLLRLHQLTAAGLAWLVVFRIVGVSVCAGGETIKSINQQSGAHVELQRNPPPSTDPNTRVFTIRGSAQQMDVARQLIDDKIGVRKPPPWPRPARALRTARHGQVMFAQRRS